MGNHVGISAKGIPFIVIVPPATTNALDPMSQWLDGTEASLLDNDSHTCRLLCAGAKELVVVKLLTKTMCTVGRPSMA